MNHKLTLFLLTLPLLICSHPALAQPTSKIHRIGFLSGGFPGPTHWTTTLRTDLRDLGYVEGKNIAIESRFAENKPDRLPALADELVRLKVDVIVAGGTNDAGAAKNATKTIPIVVAGIGIDPVEVGLVESLARPGGNVTGITNLTTDLGGKRLELLKEAIPKLARVAFLYDPAAPGQFTRTERGSSLRGSCAWADCSVLGDPRCGRFREGIRCAREGTFGWALRGRGPANAC